MQQDTEIYLVQLIRLNIINVSLQLLVQNAVSAQPCVGKL